ncbi:MAG: response regulator [Rhodocyclales bacterium]|nr:response regulator [Rhodocyclales bacterium]
MDQPNAAATPPTLLFVDDEASILSSLKRLFRPAGYRILTAGGGAEGLAILDKESVDLVVSDMRMPEMDGAHFLEQVRNRWPQVVRILLTGYADVGSTIAAINRGEIYRYVAKPWDDNEIVLTVRDALERKRLESENSRLNALTARQNEELKALNASLEQKVVERTAELRQTVSFLDQAHQELKKGFLATVNVFSGLIELRGGKLAGHSRRVAELSRQLAQRLGLDDVATQNLLLASLLHDIGKLGLADHVIEKPFNTLPAEQRADVMKHPVKGALILMGIGQLKDVAPLVRHHHECWDGSGFPDRLAGLAIPAGARMLALTNDYDALQMGTLVSRSLKPAEALAFIVENRGRRYDPALTDAFAALIAETIRTTATELPLRPNQLKPGMVLARDLTHPDGYLLLARGHAVDARIIEELQLIERSESRAVTLHILQEN